MQNAQEPNHAPARRTRRLARLTGVVVAAVIAFTTVPSAAIAQPAAPQPQPTATKMATGPKLLAQASLNADYAAPGPESGAAITPANGRSGPFPGQVIPGFSAALDAGDGTFWAMPDNGFGTKTNSRDFQLRIYQVKPRWETADGGPGDIQILRTITLTDPYNRAGFRIVNENTRQRILTGGDFDPESLQRTSDGGFWIGEEFGPWVLKFDSRGRLIERPIEFPLGMSPQNPHRGNQPAAVPQSGGFEAMPISTNGRFLYPILEKGLIGAADPRARVISELDTKSNRYTGRTWTYRVDTDANMVGDAQITPDGRLMVLERDQFDGENAVTKRVYEGRMQRQDRSGGVTKSLTVDLLRIANPDGLAEGQDYGTGDPYSFPYQSVETLVFLRDGRLMIANDNNYPFDAARVPGTPDNTEMIIIDPKAQIEVPAHENTVIGHRGASGYRPEHTLAAYQLAIEQCADFIEPDVVPTKDGVLVARHENEIGGTTNVADHPEFADRKTTKTIDGTAVTGWFTEDFTLAELRTLRAIERLPDVRPENKRFNGLYVVPTLAEVLDLARHSRTCDGKQVAVTPETKHPTYFQSIGLPLEDRIVANLDRAGLNRPNSPVVIQSFEVSNLQELNQKTPVRLSQNVDCSGAPYDWVAAGDRRTYKDLASAQGLRNVATYADDVSFCKNVMIPRNEDGTLGTPSPVIADAHAAGLSVTGWTFRVENQFLPAEFRSSADPNAPGDLVGEIRAFIDAGMDNLFTDNPDLGVVATSPR